MFDRRLGWFVSVAPVGLVGLAAAGLFVAGGASGAAGARARVDLAAQTFRVNVDGVNGSANESFLAYYPAVVRVHAGDTVLFQEVGNGDPHTVTLGTLTNNVLAAFERLSPQQQQGPPPKALLRLDAEVPQLLPRGPGDAVQAAADPCYLGSGLPPKGACPKVGQPDFTGREAYYNSGWLGSKAKFSLHLSSSVAPGTYRYMCALHREGMTGKIVVVRPAVAVASPSVQFAEGQRVLAATEAKLAPAVQAERQGKPPVPGVRLPGKTVALAGSLSPAVNEAAIDEYGPKTIRVPVGGSVIWYLLGVHTITFNSNKSNNDIRLAAPDGSVHLNPRAVAPAGGPGEPHGPPASGPPNGPPKFKLVGSTSWNGRGFLNSGIFTNSGPPLIEGYRITFTRAGTYKYLCTIHDKMKGTVIVG